ncbi:MAG: helix-turn-helix domain-containing protein [Clostridium sp.]
MYKVNKTATFKKVFIPVENTYSSLYDMLSETIFAQKIFKLRKKLGMSQREFANFTSVGYSSIYKYEIGKNPSIRNIKNIR